MKKMLVLGFVILCFFTGCETNDVSVTVGENVSSIESSSSEKQEIETEIEDSVSDVDSITPLDPIIWYADVTQDGIEDKIVVDLTYVINYPDTGEENTITIYSGSSDKIIWTEHADTVHVGWNGIYIYNDGEHNYILTWSPTFYQGNANFDFSIFSLSEDGEKKELVSKEIQFNTNKPNECDIYDIAEYTKIVNGYLIDSYVLVNTDNGIPVYSTVNNKQNVTYEDSWIFEEIENMKNHGL